MTDKTYNCANNSQDFEYENTLAKAEVRQEMIENKLGEVAKEVNVIRQEMINLALKTDVEATVKKKLKKLKQFPWRI